MAIVPKGEDVEVELEFEVTPPMRKGMLEFRALCNGAGPVVFQWAELERLP